jgi:hypothetical protein
MPFETRTKSYAFQNSILVCLAFAVLASSAWLIILYNHKVNFVNGAQKMKADIELTEAQSAAAQEKAFAIFHNGEVEQFAKNLGLVKEQHPEYIEINKPWVSASR